MSYLHDEYREIVKRLRKRSEDCDTVAADAALLIEAAEAIENLIVEVDVADYRGDED